MLTVLTSPATTALTTVPALRRELKLATEEHDQALADLIADATAAIERHLERVCARRFVRETLEGTGDAVLQLASPPIVRVTKVTNRGELVVDFDVENPDAGQLYRELGFDARFANAGAFGGAVPAGQAPRDWAVEYGAGWLLPGDDYTAASITADASDKSFNDAASGFPLLYPGEVIEVGGGANAGRKTLVTATPAKLTFVEAITSEAPVDQSPLTLRVRTLPRDIERACIATAAAWHQSQGRDPGVVSKRVADTAITYRDDASGGAGGDALPPRALSLLTPWVLD